MLHTVAQHCPYCGEPIELSVESIGVDQHYIEDCTVCCRPIEVHVAAGDGDESHAPAVHLSGENEI